MDNRKSFFPSETLINQLVSRDELNRRVFLRLLGAGAASAAALGSSIGIAGAQTEGGTLRIGLNAEPDTLDPHRTPSRYMWMVGLAMYDPLVISDTSGTIYPMLAKSWEVSEDQLTYTFSLRDDVTFHDGTPFNAEAVKFNYDRVVDPATGSLLSNDDIGPYESSTVIDEYTVEIKLSAPYGPFLRMISLMEFAIISPTAATELGLDNYGFNPVGTGPFKFVEWTLQESTVFERNPDYTWGSTDIYPISGPAHLDGIVYQYLLEAGTRIAALENGEVDAITSVPPLEVERLEGNENLVIEKYAASGHPTAFIMNTAKAPTDDVNVRRALNLAMDREALTQALYAGQNDPAYGPLSPVTFGYWPEVSEHVRFDPDEADRLLNESGWSRDGEYYQKDGEALTVELYAFGTAGPTGEAVQAELRLSGIAVNVNILEFSEQKRIAFEGLHNLIMITFGAPDPRILKLLYHSVNMRKDGWGWTHFLETSPDIQGQLDAELDAGEQTGVNEERQEHYFEAQRIITENALVLPVKNDYQIIGLSKRVSGWQMDDANYHPRPFAVSLSDE